MTKNALKKVIHIIDDDEIIRLLLERLIQSLGHDAQLSKDASAALIHLKEHTPDLIISDVQMPGMDGFSLAKELKLLPHLRSVPLVLLTAKNEYEDLRKGLLFGRKRLFAKTY